MQFETRIVNGKPSIFYKDDNPKSTGRKINTKDKLAKKEIQRSMEINGEIDTVRPSPRQIDLKNSKTKTTTTTSINSVLNKNGINLTPEQLMSLINAIKSPETNTDQNQKARNKASKTNSLENLNEDFNIRPNKSNYIRPVDDLNMSAYRQPQVVVFEEPEINIKKSISLEQLNSNQKVSLVEKKKLKWQQDKEMLEKLNKQEAYDTHKYTSPIQEKAPSFQPRAIQTPEPPPAANFFKNTMTLAEKKRLQWQQEKDNKEDLSKFYTSEKDLVNLKPTNPDSNKLKKSISLNNITNIINQEFETSNDVNQNQSQRYSLMEKKKQKWNQDKLDSNQADNWPYGRPGPGAGRVQVEQDASLPPQPPHKPKKKDAFDEYNRIKEQIQEIEATESKIKQEQQMAEIQNPSNVYHDQSKVPAAMRTSILFGGVLFDDDIKKTKELERKKWLQELENQKKEKLIESQRSLHQPQSSQLNTSSIGQPINSNQFNEDDKSFARTRNLLDPAQIEEMERKRKQNLIHKQEIEAQIAEKKRIKMLEEEIQALNNIKIENEARELKETSQMHQEIKKNQTHLQNFEKILNSSRTNNNTDKSILPSVLQGEVNKFDQDKNSSRNNITETRSQEIFRKMQEAELAAAEEKHKKLLKRLQKGGHDTSQLERKFAELKAKLTGNPSQVLNTSNTSYNPNPISNIPGLNLHTIEQNRSNNNASQLSVQNDHELKLERQKQLLTQKILNKENESKNEQSNTSRIRQIFQLLREDTNGLPAELTDEDLKLLLKNVVNNKENTEQTKKVNNKKEVKQKIVKQQEPEEEEDVQKQSGIGKDGKPIWNYKNLKGKKAIPNSMKDPFYNERAKLLEERRKKRLDYYQNQTNKVSEKQKQYLEQRNQAQRNYNDYVEDDYHRGTNRPSLLSSMSNTSNQSEVTKKQKQPESIMNLLTKNLVSNPIYEEDEDLYLNREEQKLKNASNSSFGDGLSNRGFVPFMRTNEVLDPAHAGSPIPPSRESSAVKRDREKARQSYIQNMRPADYGNNYNETSDRYRKKDPLLNNGLVRNNPTPRQEQILSQLATLKQSLIQKQKEIASSIQYDNNDNYD